jgi:ABC-type phosphate transport system substrate-binding protein
MNRKLSSVSGVLLAAAIGAVPSAGLVTASVSAADKPAVQMVANAATPSGVISRKSVQAIFRGESARWTDGTPLRPVDQSVRSDVRAAFTRDVLKDSLQGIQANWMRRIAEGRGMPPPVKPSDSEVLAFVAGNPGALGYVSASTALPSGVKAVAITD